MCTDFSGKTNEELVCILKGLNEQKTTAIKERVKAEEEERVKAEEIVSLCDSQLRNIDKDLEIILKETKRRKDNEDAKNIIGQHIKNIEDFELLSGDELHIITKNMDKTDYRKHGVSIGFYDLERICREVITIKKNIKDMVNGH
jgi:hypothetical protein